MTATDMRMVPVSMRSTGIFINKSGLGHTKPPIILIIINRNQQPELHRHGNGTGTVARMCFGFCIPLYSAMYGPLGIRIRIRTQQYGYNIIWYRGRAVRRYHIALQYRATKEPINGRVSYCSTVYYYMIRNKYIICCIIHDSQFAPTTITVRLIIPVHYCTRHALSFKL